MAITVSDLDGYKYVPSNELSNKQGLEWSKMIYGKMPLASDPLTESKPAGWQIHYGKSVSESMAEQVQVLQDKMTVLSPEPMSLLHSTIIPANSPTVTAPKTPKAKALNPTDNYIRKSAEAKAVRTVHFSTCKCRFCLTFTQVDGALAAAKTFKSYGLDQIVMSKIRSQKAIGIRELLTCVSYSIPVPLTYLAQSVRDVRPIMAGWHRQVMVDVVFEGRPQTHAVEIWARPCPTSPRHGFVDSRVVTTLKEAQDLMLLAQKADPEAELLFQPKLDAKWSAILTDTSVSVGPGNNGATAGKNSFMYRLVPQSVGNPLFNKEALKRARIEEGQTPYCEIVKPKFGKTQLVQLRAGPTLPPTVDFIPQDLKVKRVRTITAGEDEFAWEAEAKALATEPGVVVYHPGGTMASHFGVHCVINGVPYITSVRPKLRQVLVQASDDGLPDVDALHQGLSLSLVPETCSSDSWSNRGLFGTFILHNYAAEHGAEASFFLGLGAGWLWRMMAAACLGEFRHVFKYRMQGEQMDSVYTEGSNNARSTVFQRVFRYSSIEIVRRLAIATEDFLRRPTWPNGYGGLLWGRSGLMALRYWDVLQRFAQTPNVANVRELVIGLNTLVHAAHNGGLLLNKFLDMHQFNWITEMNRKWLIRDGINAIVEVRAAGLKLMAAKAIPAIPSAEWNVTPEMQAYSDDSDSVKRCDHPSGNMALAKAYEEEKNAALKMGAWIVDWSNYLENLHTRQQFTEFLSHAYEARVYYRGAGKRWEWEPEGGLLLNVVGITAYGIQLQARLDMPPFPAIVQFWPLSDSFQMVFRIPACQFWPEMITTREIAHYDIGYWKPYLNSLKGKEIPYGTPQETPSPQ